MIPLEVIHKAVARHFDLTMDQVFKRSRKTKIINARQFFHYLSWYYNKKNMSLNFIGEYYKNESNNSYDHATVRHNRIKVQNNMDIYEQCRFDCMIIKKIIQSINKEEGTDFYEKKYELISKIRFARSDKNLNKMLNNYLKTA